VTLATLASVVDLRDRHPTAAMALVVPGTLIGLAAVATYPLVFVPLVVLFGVALVVSVFNEETRRNPTC
jgi:Sec-independent protein secretion pathway component TatC